MEWVSALIGVVIGGGITIGSQGLQRRWSRGDQWTDLRRSKLEDVMVEMATAEEVAMQLLGEAVRRGLNMESEGAAKLSLSRLSALLTLYFPETRSVTEAHQQRRNAARKGHGEKLQEAIARNDADGVKSIGPLFMMETSHETQRYIHDLREVLERSAAELRTR